MDYGLFGPKAQFFEMFKAQAKNLLRTSEILHRIHVTENPKLIDPLWSKYITEIEVEGDRLSKNIHTAARKIFIVPRPFEREDIYELTTAIDNVLDFIEEAVKKLVDYRIAGDPMLNQMILIVRESVERVYQGVLCLQKIGDERLDQIADQMIDCEHRADRLEDKLIGDSYEIDVAGIIGKQPADVFTVADGQKVQDAKNFKRKRRELAEICEKAIDTCRDVFHVLGNMKLKNA